MAPRLHSASKAKSPSVRRRIGMLVGAGALVTAFSSAANPVAPAALQHTTIAQDAVTPPMAEIPSRTLSFYNLHTEERLTVTYWRNDEYNYAALQQISQLLRDRRNGQTHSVNPQTLDYVHAITQDLRRRFPAYRSNPMVIEVISGYRSTETLVQQRREGRNVAQDTSQHELGNAIDFRISGIPLTRLRDTAWCLERGGVGTYRGDGFVHVDTGRQRFWPAGERGRCPVR